MKKKNENDIFTIVVLMIIIAVLSFFLFFIIFKTIQKKHAALITETIELKYISSFDSQLAINDITAQKIYNNVFPNTVSEINISPVSIDNNYNYYSKLYTDDIVNIDSIYTYDDKSTMALKKSDKTQIVKTNINGVDYNTFKIDTLKKSYENIFGSNTFIKNNFSSIEFPNCNYNDTDYVCDINDSIETVSSTHHLITKYDNYEIDNNNLYIYENVIYFNDNEFYFSTDINGLNRINELSDLALTTTIDNISTINLDNYYKKYKHTFIIDNEDNYTWLSTQPVK